MRIKYAIAIQLDDGSTGWLKELFWMGMAPDDWDIVLYKRDRTLFCDIAQAEIIARCIAHALGQSRPWMSYTDVLSLIKIVRCKV